MLHKPSQPKDKFRWISTRIGTNGRTKHTVVAEFPQIHGIRTKRKLLQIGIGFRQQANDEHARSKWINCGHCARRFVVLCVSWRINDDDWKRHNIHPDGLRFKWENSFHLSSNASNTTIVGEGRGGAKLTWNVQKTANRITLRFLSSNSLSRPSLNTRYSKYPDRRAPHRHTNTVTINCRLSYACEWKR